MNLEERQAEMRERNRKGPVKHATALPPSPRRTRMRKQSTWRAKSAVEMEIIQLKVQITDCEKYPCRSHALPELKKKLRLLEATRTLDQHLL